jgi:hypothetical protein
MAAKAKKKIRHYASKIKRHVKAAKPSLAIISGLAAPPAAAFFGVSRPWMVGGASAALKNPQELMNRLKLTYLGVWANTAPVSLASMATSDAAKGGVIGFLVHWIANVSGANRYLARMKAPVRI